MKKSFRDKNLRHADIVGEKSASKEAREHRSRTLLANIRVETHQLVDAPPRRLKHCLAQHCIAQHIRADKHASVAKEMFDEMNRHHDLDRPLDAAEHHQFHLANQRRRVEVARVRVELLERRQVLLLLSERSGRSAHMVEYARTLNGTMSKKSEEKWGFFVIESKML